MTPIIARVSPDITHCFSASAATGASCIRCRAKSPKDGRNLKNLETRIGEQLPPALVRIDGTDQSGDRAAAARSADIASVPVRPRPSAGLLNSAGQRMSNEKAIRREVGAVALMFTGLGSIIGSGWLFGAWRAAQLAGPGAIYAWIIGAAIITFVAVTYAELGAMFPESGGAVRYGYYSHGSLVGFVAGWAAWIAIASVIPVEAEASVQYMSSWPWSWAQGLYVHAAHGHGELTGAGLLDLRGAGGAVFPGQFLEREGLCRHQQRHHVLQAHRSRRHRHRDDVHRLPCRELPRGPARRRVRRQSRLHSDRGGDHRASCSATTDSRAR